MLQIRYLFVCAVALLALSACEDFFTNNAFSSFQRDPENLSKEQLLTRATYASDRREAAKLYDALAGKVRESDGPEYNSVLVDLAVTASGVMDVLPDFARLAVDNTLDDQAALAERFDPLLDSINYDYVSAAQEQIVATREKGGTVAADQYVFVTFGLMMKSADAAGGVDSLDEASEGIADLKDFVNEANADLESRNKPNTALRELADFLNGL